MLENSQQPWVVLLGDIRRSRSLDERGVRQTAFRQLLQELNEDFATDLTVPLSISEGDAMQGLLDTPLSAWKLLDAADRQSQGFTLRFAIGVGAVSTDFAPRTWEMDGPCFQAARHAMEKAKREDRWVAFGGFDPRHDLILDAFARSLQGIREGWTARQRAATFARRQATSQKETAAALQIDPSTLSKMLKAAHYDAYVEEEEALCSMLEISWEEVLTQSHSQERVAPHER